LELTGIYPVLSFRTTALGTDLQLWIPLLLENHSSAPADAKITSNIHIVRPAG
jgi:hypothetical protein